MSSPRLVTATLSVFAVAILLAGCTRGPGAGAGDTTSDPSAGPGASDEFDDMEGTILDDGRLFAVVSWGSSSCIPRVDEVTADGQNVSVTLIDSDADEVCTADMAPRASVGALPEGVDPTKDVTLQVTYGDLQDDVDLDGDTAFGAMPGSSTEYTPSAGWFDDSSLVLLTWGSSGCPPVVDSVEGAGNTGTVTFATDPEKMCTMDMAPRATIIAFDDDAIEDEGFTLTLVGDSLDGTVPVRG
ncbi:hypothetical protein [Microbacterium sp. 1.5R]|uniref:hypothetical protein n=1 Tax=Microbacterium sp. 1.5R TaxID=1916917 RepID=UPI0011A86321|nr:hypothetical protein [Microbacterium sp. 1.5R]